MICSNCATENKPGRKFCVRCATPLTAACPSCGAPVDPGDAFCGECATPLAPTAEPAPGPARLTGPTGVPAVVSAVAERRLVTVLFADLVGFTPFAEERDAEDVRDTLTRYFELATDVIGRYGGTVEKFIGDAVMAIWGAPVAREDDAERAVRAGLELVDAVRGLGPGIQARAGVLTGEAAVTIGATNQGMVAGDLVNTAARLQSVAPPSSVLVGEATHRAASLAIAFEEAGEQVLKGKTAPVRAWRAVRVVAEIGGRNRAEGLEAPFVGRDDELRLLKDLFHATGREGRARLVSVIGPAGIGKSRLAWEFSKYADGLAETTYWHVGRSPAYGNGITFWALGEMVRRRCGLAETDDEATTRTKVAATVIEWVSDEVERRWIEPALLALLGLEANVVSDELFGAWRTFFERIAERGTVSMVFEDLHHADSGLLDFIDHLLEWNRTRPIYVVTLARPELLERRPEWHAKRSFTSIHLEPLPEPAMRELLGGLVPGLPEGAVKAIIARADGVPLYAIETVRMLVAEGKLVLADGAYQPVGDLTTLAVPETLTALIASRLDSLSPDDRALIADAAVLGQSFTVEGLAYLSGIDTPTLEAPLRGLVRRELLTLQADPRSPERGQYVFVQGLIRDVAYNTLAKSERKSRHLAAARFFESLGSDELAGGLAGHYLAAHANAAEGPESDALAGQARIALRAAAERASGLGSYEQAVGFLRQALTVTSERTDRADILELTGTFASMAGRPDEAESLLREAVQERRAIADRPRIAGAIAALGRALITNRNSDVAISLLEPASEEFKDLVGEPQLASLGSELARAYMLSGEQRRSVGVADGVLEAAEHADLVEVVADTLVTKGSALVEIGRATEGIALLRAGHQLAVTHGLTHTLWRALGNWAAAEHGRDPYAAAEIARSGLATARRLGNRPGVGLLLINATFASYRTGDWQWATDELDSALADEYESSERAELLNSSLLFHAYRGEPVQGIVDEVEFLLGGATDAFRVMTLEDTRAVVAFAQGRLREAHDGWRRAAQPAGMALTALSAARAALWNRDALTLADDLAVVEASGMRGRTVDADRTTMRAGLAALEGRSDEALLLYRDALRSWRDLRLPWDEALCAIDMATVLDPDEPDVRAAAGASREILARLGAKPFLERLESAMARSTAGKSTTPPSEAPEGLTAANS